MHWNLESPLEVPSPTTVGAQVPGESPATASTAGYADAEDDPSVSDAGVSAEAEPESMNGRREKARQRWKKKIADRTRQRLKKKMADE